MTVPGASATEVEATFYVGPGIYLIGCLERGVTLYSQQVRAHNLAWALWQREREGGRQLGRVAIVGGGVAGLTIAACVLCLFNESVTVSLFEQRWDLLPLQQGSDARWLHPKIYSWPEQGSRVPSASLPVLDWSEGRASDVARMILKEFGKYINSFSSPDRLRVYLGLRNFQISADTKEITWIGYSAKQTEEGFFHLDQPEGGATTFDTITSLLRASGWRRNSRRTQPNHIGGTRSLRNQISMEPVLRIWCPVLVTAHWSICVGLQSSVFGKTRSCMSYSKITNNLSMWRDAYWERGTASAKAATS